MKKIFQLLGCAILLVVAASCARGAAAIDKAYQQACEAQPVEKVAETLCNGGIQVPTLTSEQYAKLGAVIGYLTYNGMYSANFEDQVDMHQFGVLIRAYRMRTPTSSERLEIDSLTRELVTSGIQNPAESAQE